MARFKENPAGRFTRGIGRKPAPHLGGGVVAEAGFDPVSLFAGSETGAIYDLTDSSTVFEERSSPSTPSGNGDPIGTLLDLSGNGNDLVSAVNDTTRPTYDSSGFADFDIAESFNPHVLTQSFTLNQPITVVTAMRLLPSPENQGRGFFGKGGGDTWYFEKRTDETFRFFGGSIFDTSLTISDNEDFVITLKHVSGTASIAKNSAAYEVEPGGSNNPGGISFGAIEGTPGFPINMRLYRAIIIGRDLTDAEIANARQWCADAAGVTL